MEMPALSWYKEHFSQHPEGISQLRCLPKALLPPPQTRQGWREGTGCLSSHTTPTTPLLLTPGRKIHTNPSAPVSGSLMPRGSLHPQEATGLCLPPHNVPQSNKASTDTRAASCSKKHNRPKNPAETDSVGSAGQAVGTWTACEQPTSYGENQPRAEL